MLVKDRDRWQEIRTIHKDRDNIFIYRLGGGAVLIFIGIFIGSLIFTDNNPLMNGKFGYFTNLYTELISITVTISILDLLARKREERREIRQLKDRLIRDMRSQVNAVAIHAIEELRSQDEHNWLEDGTLQGQNLGGANLAGADLEGANLQETYLGGANLEEAILESANLNGANLGSATLRAANLSSAHLDKANLGGVNLEKAILWNTSLLDANLDGTNLTNADLKGAKLQDAEIRGANLSNADLGYAHLEGANLQSANLTGADLRGAQFNSFTVMPDGRDWTPETDVERFTNPQHPNFGQVDYHPTTTF